MKSRDYYSHFMSEHREKWFLPVFGYEDNHTGERKPLSPSFFSCSLTTQGVLVEKKHHQILFLMELETHSLLLFW